MVIFQQLVSICAEISIFSRSSRRKPGPSAESELGPGFRRDERRWKTVSQFDENPNNLVKDNS